MAGKYSALTRHLADLDAARVSMTFAEIEAILGEPLPGSARSHRPWWANSGRGHVQARGWLDAGYQSEQVDLAAERLVFVRLNAVEAVPLPPAGTGDHPLFGCMAGTITLAEGVDLTDPMFTDADMAASLDRKSALLGGGHP
jgi:hypothetical protein